ncbi:MAG: hypothetical protein V4577_07595 [Bacteroidota bacterium]
MKDKFALIFFGGLSLFNFIKNFSAYKKKQTYLTELTERGITEQEAENDSFIITWKNKKRDGILKYCLMNGVLLMGMVLAMVVGLITFLIQPSFFGTPINFVDFIEFTYPIGALLGFTLSILSWSLNERKFIHLTGTLH